MSFLSTHFDRSFIDKDLKSHRENILIDRERALMVATQPYVENLIQSEEILSKVNELEKLRSQMSARIYGLFRARDLILGSNVFGQAKKQFVQKCRNSDCKGFLSTQWRCGLCKHYSCSDCLEVLGLIRPRTAHAEEPTHGTAGAGAGAGAAAGAGADTEIDERNEEDPHICDPNTVATVSLLKRDTKPCPSCQTPIFRIEGCDQMFCTVCNTGFSWKTGRKETGIIHNPHYFEWRNRDTARAEVEEGHCCEDNGLTHHFSERTDRSIRLLNATQMELPEYEHFHRQNPLLTDAKAFRNICRWIMHVTIIDLPRFQTNDTEDNLQIRVQYMRNRLSEETFKRKIQQVDKQRSKHREYYSIISMTTAAATDIMKRFGYVIEQLANNNMSVMQIMETTFDLENARLIAYSNDRLEEISKAFKSVQYQFTNQFELRRYVYAKVADSNSTEHNTI